MLYINVNGRLYRLFMQDGALSKQCNLHKQLHTLHVCFGITLYQWDMIHVFLICIMVYGT